jgi:hypothetical protein
MRVKGDDMFRSALVAAMLLAGATGTATAATYPTFQIDYASSSVDITAQTGDCGAVPCLSASIVPSLSGQSFTPTGPNDTANFGFIRWTLGDNAVSDFSYSVTATLAFSAPDPAQAVIGGGGTGVVVSGSIVGGTLTWDQAVVSVVFAQGSILDVSFQGGTLNRPRDSIVTRASITGNDIVPVPLPAALPLLAGAFAVLGIVGMRRRRDRNA